MWQNKFYQKYALRRIDSYKNNKQRYVETDNLLSGISLRRLIHPYLKKILQVRNKLSGLSYKIVDDKSNLQQGETVIYAITHIGKFDFEVVMDAYVPFCYPVAGDWELMYGEIDDYFLRLNGVLYVDTSDRKDRNNTTKAIAKMLNQGISILIYPEGVWNLTESLPMMKIFPGAVRVAKVCNVPIVPVAVEQYGKHFLVNIGEKLYIRDGEKEEVVRLRDSLATLQWNNWELIPISKRKDIPSDYYQKYVESKLAEWPKYNLDIINGRMYKDKNLTEPKEAFEHLEYLIPCRENAFLWRR